MPQDSAHQVPLDLTSLGVLSDPKSESPSFADLGLPEELLDVLAQLNFTTPTPIQVSTIPALLAGEDIIGVAQTGTGKTAAFGLPMLATIDPTKKRTQGLVLTPTRELALQVTGALEDLSQGMPGLTVTTIYGGAPYLKQKRALEAGTQVVVGTPGRLIDHMERGTLDLSDVGFVVLDEGDEMMRMGFAEEVQKILDRLPDEHQTALFSATMSPQIKQTITTRLHNPRTIAVAPQSSTVANIDQRYAVVPPRHKVSALVRVLATSDAEATLVFVHTRATAEEVGLSLVERGVAAAVISGDVPQSEREKTVERLRSGQLDVLIGTDVAARGLDVDRIGMVVNFDMPREIESYVHRIGRTGRAGRTGIALSFISPKERDRLRRVEKATRAELTQVSIPTAVEVTTHRINSLLAKVPELLKSSQLGEIRSAVEGYLYENASTGVSDAENAIDLATALVALGIKEAGEANDHLDAELAKLAGHRTFDRAGRNRADQPHKVRVGRTRRAKESGDPGAHGHGRTHSNADETHGDPSSRGHKKSSHSALSPHGQFVPKRHGKGGRVRDTNRYWIGVGQRDGVRPGTIAQTLTSQSDLRQRDLGNIEVYGSYSIVEITPTLSRHTMKRLSQTRVAGRALRIHPDAGGTRRERY
jgi:ATP-dependent RNA helicase DeaD